MSMVEKQWLFVQDVAKLIEKAKELGFELTFGEAYRTKEQQALYYYGKTIFVNDKGFCIQNVAPRSRTMKSNHLRRLAVDFNFFKNGKLTYKKEDIQPLGDYWESLRPQNRWGGNFKSFVDTPHFEANW